MKKLVIPFVVFALSGAGAAAANPVLLAASVSQQCNQSVENAKAVAISIRKKSGDSVKLRYKKSKVNKVKNDVFRKAKADHFACMKAGLAKHSVKVE